MINDTLVAKFHMSDYKTAQKLESKKIFIFA